MKALVYTRPKELQLQELPAPQPAAAEVLLRIDAVGICGSDLHAWHGRDPRRKPGLVLGHEFVGTVVASNAPGFAPGLRFTGNPLISCGSCAYCVQGRNNLCSQRSMVGMTRPGAFAQYMALPATALIAMEQDMPDLAAALTEPAATVWHAVNLCMRALARPLHECAVLVLGGGAIGMLAGLLLRHLAVPQLSMSEPNALRRAALGAHIACELLDPQCQEAGQDRFDCVLDAVGSGATRQQALAAVKPGGVVMHLGLQEQASAIDMRKLTLAEITLLGSYTYTTADLRAAVAALHGGVFGRLAWVEQRPLADGQRAFEDLSQGRTAAAKVVLRP